MSYIDTNNIKFTSFDGNNFARGKKVSNEQYLNVSVDDLAEIAEDNGGILPTIINAVEIDWNGAELELPEELGGTKTINTTGELLKQRLQYNSPIIARVA